MLALPFKPRLYSTQTDRVSCCVVHRYNHQVDPMRIREWLVVTLAKKNKQSIKIKPTRYYYVFEGVRIRYASRKVLDQMIFFNAMVYHIEAEAKRLKPRKAGQS